MIKQAAIRQDGKIYTTSRPGRHSDIIKQMICDGIYYEEPLGWGEEGFLTEDGAFVDRIKAAEIAIRCGQIQECKHPSCLYSDDLW